jgi:acetyl esterase/lipase
MSCRLYQILFLLTIVNARGYAQKTIRLYSGNIPNSISSDIKEYSKGEDLQIFDVTVPTLTVHLPKNASGQTNKTTAVIICPGGGYGSLYINREGNDMAKAFAARGVAAFVLKYRLPSDKIMIDRTVGPLQDIQRAIRLIKERSKEFNVDTNKVGTMGFSAGGHLAASAGVLYENISVRPDFMILIYPVISMDTIVGHKGSTFNLLGNSPSEENIKKFSLELHVKKETPPTFITVASNDFLLSNTMLFCAALQKNAVPFESHIYSTGGHGYIKYPAFADWTRLLFDWMKINQWIS